MTNTNIKLLPLSTPIETTKVLKITIAANKALARLSGVAKIIPNSAILINSLVLQEAKDSSEIENIITTHDELYRASLDIKDVTNEAKEVQNYSKALLRGYDLVRENGLLLRKYIVEIQQELEQNSAGIRKQSGTNLKNLKTGEVVFTPPQDYETIQNLLTNLEKYINQPNDIDPLVNMAIIHFQFETIHPFYDGNGRTGRIINLLYLILKELLDIPILYILNGVEETSQETAQLIEQIKDLMDRTAEEVKEKLPKIYSKDLVEILFAHPYTKIDFLVSGLGITRQTASTYLKELESMQVLEEIKIGRSKFFINIELFDMLKKGI